MSTRLIIALASGLKQNQWQFIEIFSAFCSDSWKLHCFLLIYNRFLDNIYNKHKNNSKICYIFRWHPLVPHFYFNDLVCFRLFYYLYFWIGAFFFRLEQFCLDSISSFDSNSSLDSDSSLDTVSFFDLDSSLAWNSFLILKNLMKNVKYNNEFIYSLIAIPKYLIKFIAVDTWIQSK